MAITIIHLTLHKHHCTQDEKAILVVYKFLQEYKSQTENFSLNVKICAIF